MKALISFKFIDLVETIKEVTVDATKVLATINSEIDTFLKETNASIFSSIECTHTTYYEGGVNIDVRIKCNEKYFSVSEFKDFAINGFKYPNK